MTSSSGHKLYTTKYVNLKLSYSDLNWMMGSETTSYCRSVSLQSI